MDGGERERFGGGTRGIGGGKGNCDQVGKN